MTGPRTIPALLICCLCTLGGAGEDDHTRFAENGEMPRPKETAAAWKRQAETVTPAGSVPHFSGAYLWRGRADRNYVAFHQWELRLVGGERDLAGLRLRLAALDAALDPHPNGKGHWVELGRLPAGAERSLSYKLNCGKPSAYRIELAWQGGQQKYLCTQLTGLPQVEAERDNVPQLVVLGLRHDYTNRHNAIVEFRLRNIGGAEATGVTQELAFLDGDGKTVFTHEHIPEQDGAIPAGYSEQQKVVIKRAKPFESVRVSTRQAGGADGFVLDPGVFTDAAEVEIAEFKLADGKLTATLRNGTADDLADLDVTFQLLDAAGESLTEVTVPVAEAAAGTKVPLEAEVEKVEGVASWGVAFGLPEGDGADTGPQGIAGLEVEVGGITLEVLAVTPGDAGTSLRLELTNDTGADLSDLVCTLEVVDADGKHEGTVKVDALAAGKDVERTLTIEGLGEPTGLGMGWQAGK